MKFENCILQSTFKFQLSNFNPIMKLTDNWFSTMAEADNEMPIFVSGRDNLDEFRLSGKFKERVEIYWKYESIHNGMPSDSEGELMEQVIDTLRKAVEKDKLAILTGIYTGNNERTLHSHFARIRRTPQRSPHSVSSTPYHPLCRNRPRLERIPRVVRNQTFC